MKVWFLLVLLSVPFSAKAETYTFLGAQSYKDSTGKSYAIPPGANVNILNTQIDPMPATVRDLRTRKIIRLNIPKKDLGSYFDSQSSSIESAFLSNINNKLNQEIKPCINQPVSSCLLGRYKKSTSTEASLSVLLSCAPSKKLPLVKRVNTLPLKDFQSACNKGSSSLPNASKPNTWAAPIPYKNCTKEEAAILRSNEKLKFADHTAQCSGKKRPPLNLQKEPDCMLAMPTQNVKKIVLHHTEGSPIASPGALYCDYASGGYNDLPYHYYVAQDPKTKEWQVYEGRSLKHQGAHVRANLNADSVAIAIAGDYTPGGPSPQHPFAKSSAPPAEAMQLVQSLVAQLKSQYPNLANIEGHGEALYKGNGCHKNCPGPACQFLVNRLREKFFPISGKVK